MENSLALQRAVLRRFFVLHYAPNGMWTYLVSVFFMQNHDENGLLDDESFIKFLDKIIAFIWSYALTNPGVNSLRTPVFATMVNIVNNQDVTFADYLVDETRFRSVFNNYIFSNQRAVTKSFITWWAFTFENQELLNIEKSFDTEHIFSKARQRNNKILQDPRSIELLGNKALLEKRINIRASDYKFEDKKKYYLGFDTSRGKKRVQM